MHISNYRYHLVELNSDNLRPAAQFVVQALLSSN